MAEIKLPARYLMSPPASGWTPLFAGCGDSPPPACELNALHLPPRPPSCSRTGSTPALRTFRRTTNPSIPVFRQAGNLLVLVVRLQRSTVDLRHGKVSLGPPFVSPRLGPEWPSLFRFLHGCTPLRRLHKDSPAGGRTNSQLNAAQNRNKRSTSRSA